MQEPRPESIQKMWRYAEKFAEKSGTHLHPDRFITEGVVLGLAANIDQYGRPICPCNFYPAKDENGNWPEGLYLPREEEAKRRTWICARPPKRRLTRSSPCSMRHGSTRASNSVRWNGPADSWCPSICPESATVACATLIGSARRCMSD